MDRTGAYCELIMSSNYDYIMNQIEKASQLLAALISSKKSEQKQEAEINKTLAELTGLDIDLFAQKENVATARVLLVNRRDKPLFSVFAKYRSLNFV